MIRAGLILLLTSLNVSAFAQTKEKDLPALYQSTIVPYFQTGNPIDFVGEAGIHLRGYEFSGGSTAVLIVPGWGETARKWAETIYDLHNKGLTVFVYAHRGMGESQRIIGCKCTYVEDYENYVKDLVGFVTKVIKPKHFSKLFLLAHSMGGGVATKALQDNPGLVDGAILASPLIKPYTAPWPYGVGKAIVDTMVAVGRGNERRPFDKDEKLKYDGNIRTTSETRWTLTNDIEVQQPKLSSGWATNRWLHEIFQLSESIRSTKKLNKTPTLLLQSEDDKYVLTSEQTKICKKWGASCRLVKIPGTRHEILEEKDPARDQAFDLIMRFIEG